MQNIVFLAVAILVMVILFPNRRIKTIISTFFAIGIAFLVNNYFYSLGLEKNSKLLSMTGMFLIVGFIIISLVFKYQLRLIRDKKLNDSNNIVNGKIIYIKEVRVVTDLSESRYKKTKSKYKIAFEYLDSYGNKNKCFTHDSYTLEEIDDIKGVNDILKITVVGKLCKINEEFLYEQKDTTKYNNDSFIGDNSQQNEIKNLKNIPIHKMGGNKSMTIYYRNIFFWIVAIILFSALPFRFLDSSYTYFFTIIGCALFIIILSIKEIIKNFIVIRVYKKGEETCAIKFDFKCKRTRRKVEYFIVYAYKTEKGIVREKRQEVPVNIYQNIRYIETLPIKVLKNEASIDIEKIENFTEYL